MTRQDLVKFLTGSYKPKEELIWQTITFGDVESVEGSTEEMWNKFVEQAEHYGQIHDEISELVFNAFYEFVENYTEGDTDE